MDFFGVDIPGFAPDIPKLASWSVDMLDLVVNREESRPVDELGVRFANMEAQHRAGLRLACLG